MNAFTNAGYYLTDSIFNFFLYLVLLRFWMQWVQANFRNQVGQFIITVTNPFIIPIRRVIPSIGTLDAATLLLASSIALLKTTILMLLVGISPDWLKVITFSLSELIKCSVYIFMAAVFIQIIMSWVSPRSYHPILSIVNAISEPLMAPARRLIPSIGGLDLSPILVFMFLRLTQILIVNPLQAL